jgi:photosystem II stability/assembly factor-like uncharacterized protein
MFSLSRPEIRLNAAWILVFVSFFVISSGGRLAAQLAPPATVVWEPVSGLPPAGMFNFTRVDATTLLAGAINNQANGLYRSTDDGRTWSLVPGTQSNIPSKVRNYRGLAANGNQVIAFGVTYTASSVVGTAAALPDDSVYVSSNGGLTWQAVTPLARSTAGTSVFPTSPFIDSYFTSLINNRPVFLGSTLIVLRGGGGVFNSANNGRNFTSARGLPTGSSLDSVNGEIILAQTSLGQESWVTGHRLARINGTLTQLVGTRLYRTTDGGNSWSQAPAPRLPAGPYFFRNIVKVGSIILVSAGDANNLPEELPPLLFRSADNGETWTTLTNSPVNNFPSWFTISKNDAGYFVASDSSRRGILISNDGLTWVSANTGLPTATAMYTSGNYISNAVSGPTLFAYTANANFTSTTYFRGAFVTTTGVPTGFDALETQVFPNPAQNLVSIESNLKAAGSVTVRLTNVLGTKVVERVETATAGMYRTSVDVSGLPAGVYFLRVEAGAQAWIEKVVKQ